MKNILIKVYLLTMFSCWVCSARTENAVSFMDSDFMSPERLLDTSQNSCPLKPEFTEVYNQIIAGADRGQKLYIPESCLDEIKKETLMSSLRDHIRGLGQFENEDGSFNQQLFDTTVSDAASALDNILFDMSNLGREQEDLQLQIDSFGSEGFGSAEEYGTCGAILTASLESDLDNLVTAASDTLSALEVLRVGGNSDIGFTPNESLRLSRRLYYCDDITQRKVVRELLDYRAEKASGIRSEVIGDFFIRMMGLTRNCPQPNEDQGDIADAMAYIQTTINDLSFELIGSLNSEVLDFDNLGESAVIVKNLIRNSLSNELEESIEEFKTNFGVNNIFSQTTDLQLKGILTNTLGMKLVERFKNNGPGITHDQSEFLDRLIVTLGNGLSKNNWSEFVEIESNGPDSLPRRRSTISVGNERFQDVALRTSVLNFYIGQKRNELNVDLEWKQIFASQEISTCDRNKGLVQGLKCMQDFSDDMCVAVEASRLGYRGASGESFVPESNGIPRCDFPEDQIVSEEFDNGRPMEENFPVPGSGYFGDDDSARFNRRLSFDNGYQYRTGACFSQMITREISFNRDGECACPENTQNNLNYNTCSARVKTEPSNIRGVPPIRKCIIAIGNQDEYATFSGTDIFDDRDWYCNKIETVYGNQFNALDSYQKRIETYLLTSWQSDSETHSKILDHYRTIRGLRNQAEENYRSCLDLQFTKARVHENEFEAEERFQRNAGFRFANQVFDVFDHNIENDHLQPKKAIATGHSRGAVSAQIAGFEAAKYIYMAVKKLKALRNQRARENGFSDNSADFFAPLNHNGVGSIDASELRLSYRERDTRGGNYETEAELAWDKYLKREQALGLEPPMGDSFFASKRAIFIRKYQSEKAEEKRILNHFMKKIEKLEDKMNVENNSGLRRRLGVSEILDHVGIKGFGGPSADPYVSMMMNELDESPIPGVSQQGLWSAIRQSKMNKNSTNMLHPKDKVSELGSVASDTNGGTDFGFGMTKRIQETRREEARGAVTVLRTEDDREARRRERTYAADDRGRLEGAAQRLGNVAGSMWDATAGRAARSVLNNGLPLPRFNKGDAVSRLERNLEGSGRGIQNIRLGLAEEMARFSAVIRGASIDNVVTTFGDPFNLGLELRKLDQIEARYAELTPDFQEGQSRRERREVRESTTRPVVRESILYHDIGTYGHYACNGNVLTIPDDSSDASLGQDRSHFSGFQEVLAGHNEQLEVRLTPSFGNFD